MKTPSEADAMALRQVARGILLKKDGDKVTPRSNISASELRSAAAALSIAHRLEKRVEREEKAEAIELARTWFMQDKSRTLQAAADKFGVRYLDVRRVASGDGWLGSRDAGLESDKD